MSQWHRPNTTIIMIKIKNFVFNPFGVNTYVISDTDTGEAIVVDPGMINSREHTSLDNYIAENGLKIQQIVNTHLHLDHCFGDNYVRDKYGVKVAANVNDAPLGSGIAQQARSFGMCIPEGQDFDVSIDVPLNEGDVINIGPYKLHVIEIPGHSAGSIALYCPEGKFVIVGDALFRGAVGRTDLPGGDFNTLASSIRNKLYTLPDDTKVLAGHDMPTDIGTEKKNNPYVRSV